MSHEPVVHALDIRILRKLVKFQDKNQFVLTSLFTSLAFVNCEVKIVKHDFLLCFIYKIVAIYYFQSDRL